MTRRTKLTACLVAQFVRFTQPRDNGAGQMVPSMTGCEIGDAEGLLLFYRQRSWILPFANAMPEAIQVWGGPWGIKSGVGLDDVSIQGSVGAPVDRPGNHFEIKDGWIEDNGVGKIP